MPGSNVRTHAVLCVLTIMISCKQARADEARTLTHLSWSAPAASGCIPARELQRSVEDLLGRKAFAERTEAGHELIGVVERQQGEWIAVLQLGSTRDSARQLSSAHECASLNRPLAIVIATLLDTELDSIASIAAPPALSLGLALDARSGILPQAIAGGRLSVQLTAAEGWPLLRFQVGAWLPQRVIQKGLGASFQVFQVGLIICPELVAQGVLTLAVCAGVEAGALRARALGLVAGHTPTRLLLSLPLEAALMLRLWRGAALRFELGPALAVLRPAFYFDDSDRNPHVVQRVAQFGGSARLGFIADLL